MAAFIPPASLVSGDQQMGSLAAGNPWLFRQAPRGLWTVLHGDVSSSCNDVPAPVLEAWGMAAGECRFIPAPNGG